jgi:hypothetical protein
MLIRKTRDGLPWQEFAKIMGPNIFTFQDWEALTGQFIFSERVPPAFLNVPWTETFLFSESNPHDHHGHGIGSFPVHQTHFAFCGLSIIGNTPLSLESTALASLFPELAIHVRPFYSWVSRKTLDWRWYLLTIEAPWFREIGGFGGWRNYKRSQLLEEVLAQCLLWHKTRHLSLARTHCQGGQVLIRAKKLHSLSKECRQMPWQKPDKEGLRVLNEINPAALHIVKTQNNERDRPFA